jgi:hypothetical protein
MAKRILRDPNLCQIASRKFHKLIDKNNDGKFLSEDAWVGELVT